MATNCSSKCLLYLPLSLSLSLPLCPFLPSWPPPPLSCTLCTLFVCHGTAEQTDGSPQTRPPCSNFRFMSKSLLFLISLQSTLPLRHISNHTSLCLSLFSTILDLNKGKRFHEQSMEAILVEEHPNLNGKASEMSGRNYYRCPSTSKQVQPSSRVASKNLRGRILLLEGSEPGDE